MIDRTKLDIRFATGLLAGLVLIALTRLPQVSGGNAMLDGDEAIVGLMAKHLAEGRSSDIFYYGQGFGLAIFESAPAALFFLLFGVSTLSLKWATLFVWTLGWALFVLAVRKLTDTRWALVAGLLLIVCPAWSLWSMITHGYHVAGFMLTQLCLLLAVHLAQDDRPRRALSVALGASGALLLLTQGIWFLSFAPIAGYVLWKRKKRADLGMLAAGGGSMCALVYLWSIGRVSSYWSPGFLEGPDPIQALLRLPERLWVGLSGAYYYETVLQAGRFNVVAAWLWTALVGFAAYRACVALYKRESPALPHACLLAIAAPLAISLFINPRGFGFRYLLPVASFVTLFAVLDLSRVKSPKLTQAVAGAAIALCVTGIGALFEARSYRYTETLEPTARSEKQSIDELIADLTAANIAHVYSVDPMFQWNIMFASNERILARWRDPKDRRPEYPKAVDAALYAGKPVAIVGQAAQWKPFVALAKRLGHKDLTIRRSGGRYFWVPNPGIAVLESFGYVLNEPVATTPHR